MATDADMVGGGQPRLYDRAVAALCCMPVTMPRPLAVAHTHVTIERLVVFYDKVDTTFPHYYLFIVVRYYAH